MVDKYHIFDLYNLNSRELDVLWAECNFCSGQWFLDVHQRMLAAGGASEFDNPENKKMFIPSYHKNFDWIARILTGSNLETNKLGEIYTVFSKNGILPVVGASSVYLERATLIAGILSMLKACHRTYNLTIPFYEDIYPWLLYDLGMETVKFDTYKTEIEKYFEYRVFESLDVEEDCLHLDRE